MKAKEISDLTEIDVAAIRRDIKRQRLVPRRGISEWGTGLTKQSFKDSCDINIIVKQFQSTGMVEHARAESGMYADVSEMGDYHASVNAVQEADRLFMTVPAIVRAKFANDPGKFLEFVNDAKNLDAMHEMGLTNKKLPVPAGGENNAEGNRVSRRTSNERRAEEDDNSRRGKTERRRSRLTTKGREILQRRAEHDSD